MQESPLKNAYRSLYQISATSNTALAMISKQISSSIINSLTLARISQHAAIPATALLIPLPASLMTSDHLLPRTRNPVPNPAKRSSLINATTPLIMITTVNEANLDIGRNVALYVIKKVVSLQNIQRKNEKS